MNQIQTKPFFASSLNLAEMLTIVNPIDFIWRSQFKGEDHDGYR